VSATDRARALAFLAAVVLRRDTRPGRAVPLVADGDEVDADVYRPRMRPPSGTVLFVHGMSLLAHRDPRVVAACNALAAAGLQVVAPRVAGLCDLALDTETPARIAALMRACGSAPGLGRPRSVAVASASFAAGLCIKAAARSEVRDQVGPLLLFGTYVDARALIDHLLTSREPDPFGRLILVRAFLARGAPITTGVADAIDVALADESLRADPPRLPDVLARLSDDDARAFRTLRNDSEAGERLAEEIAASHTETIDALCAVGDLARLEAPVALVHGRNDRVIPPSESLRAEEILAAHGVPCRAWITAMLDHGDLSSSLAKLAEVPKLLDVFAYWFGAVRRASATTATAAHVASSTTNGQYPMR
jgi:pimeloyl-ACP methyl ester carboxylesterase